MYDDKKHFLKETIEAYASVVVYISLTIQEAKTKFYVYNKKDLTKVVSECIAKGLSFSVVIL